MSLANKFGSAYEAVKDKIKIKTIHLKLNEAEFDLKVRIPLKSEMEMLSAKIAKPNEERAKAIYEKLAEPIKKSIEDGGEEFLKAINKDKDFIIIRDDDLIVDGNSVKNIANVSSMWETKVEEYFHLLISEIGDPINETFEQISEEFPEEIIKQIVDEIEKAIKPDYSSVKKN